MDPSGATRTSFFGLSFNLIPAWVDASIYRWNTVCPTPPTRGPRLGHGALETPVAVTLSTRRFPEPRPPAGLFAAGNQQAKATLARFDVLKQGTFTFHHHLVEWQTVAFVPPGTKVVIFQSQHVFPTRVDGQRAMLSITSNQLEMGPVAHALGLSLEAPEGLAGACAAQFHGVMLAVPPLWQEDHQHRVILSDALAFRSNFTADAYPLGPDGKLEEVLQRSNRARQTADPEFVLGACGGITFQGRAGLLQDCSCSAQQKVILQRTMFVAGGERRFVALVLTTQNLMDQEMYASQLGLPNPLR